MNLFKLFPTKKRAIHSLQELNLSPQIQAVRRLYEKGDYPAAIASCNQILDQDPTNEEAYRLRGFAKYKLGDTEGASADVKQAGNLAKL